MKAGVDALGERRARRDGEQLRQPVAERARDRDRAVGAPDADVGVEAEGVVLPDDVAEDLVVAAVVRRVDDPLVLPVRPRVRAGGAEREAERLDERDRAASRRSAIVAGTSAKRLDPAGLDLGLGGDQLAGEMSLGRRSGGRRLHVLEAVDEVERVGVEQREFLLDGDREVGGRVEPLARSREKLIVGTRCSSPMERKRLVDAALLKTTSRGSARSRAS